MGKGGGHLATGIGAAGPVHAHGLGDVQLVLQLCGDGHGSLLGFDEGHAAELGPSAADQAPSEGLWLQAVLLEERLFLQDSQTVNWGVRFRAAYVTGWEEDNKAKEWAMVCRFDTRNLPSYSVTPA